VGTYLVVAHRTLIGEHLLEYVRELAEQEDCRFHLLVPARHPHKHMWTEGQINAAAQQRLQEGLDAFGAAGLEATGETGDENPVYAASTALRGLDFTCDGIIVSTLPSHLSQWLRVDLVSRLRREFDLPVTHLTARETSTSTPA
jgi:hypothetical protein